MELNNYRAFTEQLKANVAQDARVLGLIAMGSMAEINRTPDEWSDHDFFLITVPDVQEDFRQDLSWLPHPEQIVMTIRETAHGLKVLYREGHLLEFAVFDREELSLAKCNDYRILIDRDNLEPLMVKASERPLIKPALQVDTKMVIALIYVGVGRYARGEYLSAHVFLKHHLLHHLLRLVSYIVPADNKDRLDNLDPFRRFEVVYPVIGAEINRLLMLPIPECGLGLLDLLDQHIAPLLDDYPAEAVEVVRKYVGKAL